MPDESLPHARLDPGPDRTSHGGRRARRRGADRHLARHDRAGHRALGVRRALPPRAGLGEPGPLAPEERVMPGSEGEPTGAAQTPAPAATAAAAAATAAPVTTAPVEPPAAEHPREAPQAETHAAEAHTPWQRFDDL